MKMNQYRVSLGFGKLSAPQISYFASTVHDRLYAEAPYAEPPVTAADLQAQIDALDLALAKQSSGGTAATAEKDARALALLLSLQKLAGYVQGVAAADLPLLLASGFKDVSKNRASSPIPKPSIIRIANGLSGQALVTVGVLKLAKSYEVVVSEIDEDGTPGPARPPVARTSSRKLPVDGLTPGRLYSYRVRVMGGTTVYSDWSDAVVQRVL